MCDMYGRRTVASKPDNNSRMISSELSAEICKLKSPSSEAVSNTGSNINLEKNITISSGHMLEQQAT